MDITVYFLKLEDKYWGLFLIGLFLLFVLAKSKREKTGPLFVCAFTGYLVFLCPLTYRVLGRFYTPTSRYELLSHIFCYPVVLPLAAALGWDALSRNEAAEKKRRLRAALYGCFLCLLFFLAGDFFLFSRQDFQGENFYDGAGAASYAAVLEDAAETGYQPVLWGPADWMAGARLYDGKLQPLYGKDITDNPDAYGQVQQLMKQGYDSYESPDAPPENREDQLGAIANFPNLYPELALSYVAVFDPAGEGLFVDADGIFEETGYSFVGKYDDLLVYKRNR